jgi:hypothetical protein
MAGLGPAIHLLRKTRLKRGMDARVKPAHDERNVFVTAPALQRTTREERALRCVRGTRNEVVCITLIPVVTPCCGLPAT